MAIILNKANCTRIIATAHTLVGIHEIPDGSNDGTRVRGIQESTGAYKAPWCVSTCQSIWIRTFANVKAKPLADGTANAYYFESYAQKHGWAVPRAFGGAFVVYHIGAGHMGTVINVHNDGSFDAIEGNEGNAVKIVHRDPRTLRMTFILHPWLRGSVPHPDEPAMPIPRHNPLT